RKRETGVDGSGLHLRRQMLPRAGALDGMRTDHDLMVGKGGCKRGKRVTYSRHASGFAHLRALVAVYKPAAVVGIQSRPRCAQGQLADTGVGIVSRVPKSEVRREQNIPAVLGTDGGGFRGVKVTQAWHQKVRARVARYKQLVFCGWMLEYDLAR